MTAYDKQFNQDYQTHLKHLKLKGLQPKTIEAYTRAMRRVGAYFNNDVNGLSEAQLTDYFSELLASHSWSSVKLDLYGLRFFYTYVLDKPFPALKLIKPPRAQRLPDIVTVVEVEKLFTMTRFLSYRVFFFTLYSLGLRLGEGLRLTVADIDAARMRVHIRDAKGNKDRLVPLPLATLACLRRFWQVQPQSGVAVPKSPRWLEVGAFIYFASGSWRGAGYATQSNPRLRHKKKISPHSLRHSILTTARYTHLTDTTKIQADALINALMDGFIIDWKQVK